MPLGRTPAPESVKIITGGIRRRTPRRCPEADTQLADSHNEKKRILIVDDEQQIRVLLERYLSNEGFQVFTVSDGTAMRETMSRHEIDIAVLDVRLPGEDGFVLLRELRRNSSLPVIMLSDRSEVFDRVAGLEAGADDYLPKPFAPRELLARVNAVLRRDRGEEVEREQTTPPTLSFADFSMNLASRQLFGPGGKEIILTPMEFEILATLARNPQRALDRDFLLEAAVGADVSALERTIDVHIGRLRKKIESDSVRPSLIKTVRGAGYIFSAKVHRDH